MERYLFLLTSGTYDCRAAYKPTIMTSVVSHDLISNAVHVTNDDVTMPVVCGEEQYSAYVSYPHLWPSYHVMQKPVGDG